ncbi:MAG: hypothetical protein L6R39_001542 [Caloplaca ligustica]|nr:MAG: hypothetical protein L6R39_001542 [Caloplaca ligustica]
MASIPGVNAPNLGCFQANCLEYVAIAGRTGAVKSSLVSGLFRQTELSRGSVSIDGAALDMEIDDHIQQIMRRAFRDRAVLCIAHRSHTFSLSLNGKLDRTLYDLYSLDGDDPNGTARVFALAPHPDGSVSSSLSENTKYIFQSPMAPQSR